MGDRSACLRESGKEPVSRERLIREVRTGMMEEEQVARRTAGKGSSEQDLAGEPFTNSVTYLSVSGEKAIREDVAKRSGNRVSRLERSVRSGRVS